MREIKKVYIHCSATRQGTRFTYEDCKRYHMEFKGWVNIGYHYYIEVTGEEFIGRSEKIMGAGVKGDNEHSLHICYEGGLDTNGYPLDTRTVEQKAAILDRLFKIQYIYGGVEILGHRDWPYTNKACPSFDAKSEYAWINK